jgi:hypothetical protein
VALADFTDPEAVRAAMRQYDELGQEGFQRYGFAPASATARSSLAA